MGRRWLLIGGILAGGACNGEQAQQEPVRLEKPGFVTLEGRLVDRERQPVSEYRELFPEELAPYLDRPAGEPARILVGDLTDPKKLEHRDTVTTDAGKFETKVPPDSTLLLRTDFGGVRLHPQRLKTGREDMERAIEVLRLPFVVYGEVRDKKTGDLITDHITIDAGGRHASTLSGRYALHFDREGPVELAIQSRAHRHLDLKETVTVEGAELRHDLVLAPLSEAAGSITLTVNMEGEKPKKEHHLWVKLEGPDGFSSRVDVKASPFELTVPTAGEYTVRAHGDGVHLDLPATLTFSENASTTATLFPRDTELLVILKVPSGKALGFADPKPKRKDEPRTNCVILEREGIEPGEFVTVAPGEAGEAVRPNRRGHVEFHVHEGGPYTIRTTFNGYKDRVKQVDLKPHVQEKVYLTLEPKG